MIRKNVLNFNFVVLLCAVNNVNIDEYYNKWSIKRAIMYNVTSLPLIKIYIILSYA